VSHNEGKSKNRRSKIPLSEPNLKEEAAAPAQDFGPFPREWENLDAETKRVLFAFHRLPEKDLEK